MKFYIKVGNKYFKGFESINRGYGGHTINGEVAEITKVNLISEKNEISALSVKNIIGELVNLMRYGDIKVSDIKIEVEEG